MFGHLKPDPDGNVIVDEKEIMHEIHSYYADLYKSEVDSDKSDDSGFNNFTANLELPKLSDDERDEIEGKLTLEECQNILKTLKLGKSPGEDGYTVQMFNCFFEILGQDLLNSNGNGNGNAFIYRIFYSYIFKCGLHQHMSISDLILPTQPMKS